MKCLSIFFLLLTACTGHVTPNSEVLYTEIGRAEMTELAGGDDTRLGWTTWDEYGNWEIFMMPPEEYPNQECYDAILAHEVKHTYRHDFHPNAPGRERDLWFAVNESEIVFYCWEQ
jgi:hypothetical protein